MKSILAIPIRTIAGIVACTLLLLSCQPGGSQQTHPTTSSSPAKLSERRTYEDSVAYPQGQSISIEPAAQVIPPAPVYVQYKGYDRGAFRFSVSSASPDFRLAEGSYGLHIHFDNREPVLVYDSVFTMDLPEGDHLLCAYPVDAQGMSIRNPGAHTGKMIRILNGEIIKTADIGIMLFYNQPRSEYDQADPEGVLLDFYLLNAPMEEVRLKARIDDREFDIPENRPYRIKGLEKGVHMVELTLYRWDEVYNLPLNPSRMQFKVR